MNVELLWELSLPSTALLQGPLLIHHAKRKDEIRFSIEDDVTCRERVVSLLFSNVYASKCTYRAALQVPMIECAYERLVAIKGSAWLQEITATVAGHEHFVSGADSRPLRHMMITFDDGPCYEFAATGWEVVFSPGMA